MSVIWNIATLERNTSDDGVIIAHWSAYDSEVVSDVKHGGTEYGSCSFTPDSTAADFVAYADITSAIAIGWVKAKLGADVVTSVEARIAEQITLSKNPVKAVGVPW